MQGNGSVNGFVSGKRRPHAAAPEQALSRSPAAQEMQVVVRDRGPDEKTPLVDSAHYSLNGNGREVALPVAAKSEAAKWSYKSRLTWRKMAFILIPSALVAAPNAYLYIAGNNGGPGWKLASAIAANCAAGWWASASALAAEQKDVSKCWKWGAIIPTLLITAPFGIATYVLKKEEAYKAVFVFLGNLPLHWYTLVILDPKKYSTVLILPALIATAGLFEISRTMVSYNAAFEKACLVDWARTVMLMRLVGMRSRLTPKTQPLFPPDLTLKERLAYMAAVMESHIEPPNYAGFMFSRYVRGLWGWTGGMLLALTSFGYDCSTDSMLEEKGVWSWAGWTIAAMCMSLTHILGLEGGYALFTALFDKIFNAIVFGHSIVPETLLMLGLTGGLLIEAIGVIVPAGSGDTSLTLFDNYCARSNSSLAVVVNEWTDGLTVGGTVFFNMHWWRLAIIAATYGMVKQVFIPGRLGDWGGCREKRQFLEHVAEPVDQLIEEVRNATDQELLAALTPAAVKEGQGAGVMTKALVNKLVGETTVAQLKQFGFMAQGSEMRQRRAPSGSPASNSSSSHSKQTANGERRPLIVPDEEKEGRDNRCNRFTRWLKSTLRL